MRQSPQWVLWQWLLLLALIIGAAPAEAARQPNPASLVTLQAVASHTPIRPGDRFQVAVTLDIQEGWHIYSAAATDNIPTTVRITGPKGFAVTGAHFPPASPLVDAILHTTYQVYTGRAVVILDVQAPAALRGPVTLMGTVAYQPCTEKICLMSAVKRFSIALQTAAAGTPVTAISPALFAAGAETQPPLAPGAGRTAGRPAFGDTLKHGLLMALLWAFLWGLAASITPCVYPMIPITIAYFGAQAGQRRSRVVLMALVYVLGIVITFSVLGMVSALAGRQLGAWLTNPWVIHLIAAMLIAMAASLFGLFEMTLPPGLLRVLQPPKHSILGPLAMGLMLGFVAAPCVGPFLASILLVVAQTRDLLVGFASLFAFGLGMGVLILALALVSNAAVSLPKSGPWLIGLKQVFGVLLIGAALYFEIISGLLPPWVAWVVTGVFLILLAGHWRAFEAVPRSAGAARRIGKAGGLLVVALGGYLTLTGLEGSPLLNHQSLAPERLKETPASVLSWLTDDAAIRDPGRIAKASGKPVFMDFRADWCIPCRQFEATTLQDPAIIEELRTRFTLIRIDLTKSDSPYIQLKIDRYHSYELPFYAFYGPDGTYLADKSQGGELSAEEFLKLLKTIPGPYSM